ncbi:hypothetical protein [Kitasatospora sp. GP82]|uniref:hypothetical protein n=1 Tax=Kitasatospora sp. GP82 TaxID=3035089 RepID=UPI002475E699|nr:hypothetical protein [Kitasatospora sp. GP82]
MDNRTQVQDGLSPVGQAARGRVVVEVRPFPANVWFHRAFTRPVVEIDGVEFGAVWGENEVAVGAGSHEIAVFFRYRGQRKARLGLGHGVFRVDTSAAVTRVRAALGPTNGSRFRISVG